MKKHFFLGTLSFISLFLNGFEVYAEAVAPKVDKKKPQDLKITISGQAAFNAFSGSQKQKEYWEFKANSGEVDNNGQPVKNKSQSNMFSFDSSKLNFQIEGRTDPGMLYQANLVLTGDKNAPRSVKQAYLTFQGSWGTVILGNFTGVSDSMGYYGADVVGGTGGFDGLWTRFINTTTGTETSVDLGGSPTGNTGDATKATYLTPEWNGFQLGVSYTPDSKHTGQAKLKTSGFTDPDGVPLPYIRNALEVGLNYTHSFYDDVSLALSLTGLTGKVQPEFAPTTWAIGKSLDRKSVNAWALGGIFTYKNISVAGEYIDNRNSGQFSKDTPGVLNPQIGEVPAYTASQAKGAKIYNAGVGVTLGAFKLSASYYHSKRSTGFLGKPDATANIYTAGCDYNVAPGLTFYVEGAHHTLKNPSALYQANGYARNLHKGAAFGVANQNSNVVLIGTKIKF